ncbi:MAG: NADP-dependent malic enzyme [archaeon GB-1867-097]|nr:NADP-dependent malic enzyme [Candidatus Culexmicrobium thermophilum]MCS7384585.1 NADP-dependent malic enzyme [Candidatus Culexmicrobium thermophilum]HDO20645.1 NADP-dependent malic enzyme [Candidatus Bathyarchaeota archaeon]
MKKMTVDELLKKAEKPSKMAPPMHKFYLGKVQVIPRCPVRSLADFSIWYTPGVAAVCRKVKENPDLLSFEYTSRWNYVAVVSDCTRVLGLGDIGPEAGMPVMEGKALLFKYLGGVDAFPLCIKTKDPDEIIKFLKLIEPTFGGINLEDIAKPKCFYILEKAREELNIPVWHDDQQGTATVVLAGVLNALKLVGKKLSEVKITLIGAGAANIKCADVLELAGAKPGNIVFVDSKGILHAGRRDILEKEKNPWKWKWAAKSNAEGKMGGIPEALENADVCIAASRPGPGIIKKEWISKMADDAIVFAMANPVPEIWPWEVKEAGARIIGTGRSDFPNQVNNSLGFPAIFRGVLDVRARTVTDEMCVAAANALAKHAEEKGLSEDYIIPTMDDWEVYPKEAVACALKSIEQGVARIKPSRQELWERAVKIISDARKSLDALVKAGIIKPPPPEEELLSTY